MGEKIATSKDVKAADFEWGAASSHGDDSYAITIGGCGTSYETYRVYAFKADVANTGAATLNINGLGAVAIKKGSSDLETGDIEAGQIVLVIYDGTYFQKVQGGLTQVAQNINGVKNFTSPPIGVKSCNYQVFTGNGTWTKPSNLTGNELVIVQMWAGGGGGGGAATGTGGGGGGGSYNEAKFRASDLSSTVSVTVGGGGNGGASSGTNPGSVGGTSSFGSYLYAYGGGGGAGDNHGSGPGWSGGGGSGGGPLSAGGVGVGLEFGPNTGTRGGGPFGGYATANSVQGMHGWGGGWGCSTGYGSDGIFGGGGGGMASSGNSYGGNSYYGGGGGGGGGYSGNSAGGTSILGGNGGAGASNSAGNGSNGSIPAGGGGGAQGGGGGHTGGNGARGECRVWVIYQAN